MYTDSFRVEGENLSSVSYFAKPADRPGVPPRHSAHHRAERVATRRESRRVRARAKRPANSLGAEINTTLHSLPTGSRCYAGVADCACRENFR